MIFIFEYDDPASVQQDRFIPASSSSTWALPPAAGVAGPLK